MFSREGSVDTTTSVCVAGINVGMDGFPSVQAATKSAKDNREKIILDFINLPEIPMVQG